MAIYLGVDIGTTSAKCLAVDEDGRVLGLAQQSYPMARPLPGWAEQDPEDYWLALVSTVNQCVALCREQGRDASEIASLAMSTQGDTLIVTDERGSALMPAISWMDSRGEIEHDELLAETGRSFWYREAATLPDQHSSVCSMRWLQKNRRELWAQVRRVCYVADYLALRLCGKHVSDVPSASWTPLFSPRERKWSSAVLDLLGVPQENLPLTVESGEAMGELLPEVAAKLGVNPSTRLIAGAFDQAAAACGAGAGPDGRGVLSCGTAWVLYSVAMSPPLDELERLPLCCHTTAAEWGIVLPFSGGSTYDWLLSTCGARQESSATESTPLVFIPHLYGEICPGWHSESRGSLLGLSMSHTFEDVRLALMRGLACETRRNMEAGAAAGVEVRRVRMVGGATKSDIWPQIIADVLDRPIEIPDCAESACYGAAKLAAGAVSSAWTGAQSIREVNPNPAGAKDQSDFFEQYIRFLEALTPVYGGK